MTEARFRSRLLGKEGTVSRKGVTFDDGVVYTASEVAALRGRATPVDLRAVHHVKAAFGGEVEFVQGPVDYLAAERRLPTEFPANCHVWSRIPESEQSATPPKKKRKRG